MTEWIKGLCVLGIVAGVFVGLFVWTDSEPTAVTWALRLGSVASAVGGLLVFILLELRRDTVPAYLAEQHKYFFDRHSFCFAFCLWSEDGVGWLHVYFQNRCEGACTARVALRWTGSAVDDESAMSLSGGQHGDWKCVDLRCDGGAYGLVRAPIAVPVGLQGSVQTFDVGADVVFDDAKGHALWHAAGFPVRCGTDFRLPGEGVTSVFSWLGGIRLQRPQIELMFPEGVVERFAVEMPIELQVVWRPGDPPLEATPYDPES